MGTNRTTRDDMKSVANARLAARTGLDGFAAEGLPRNRPNEPKALVQDWCTRPITTQKAPARDRAERFVLSSVEVKVSPSRRLLNCHRWLQYRSKIPWISFPQGCKGNECESGFWVKNFCSCVRRPLRKANDVLLT